MSVDYYALAEQIVAEYTSDWEPEGWEGEDEDNLVEQAEQMLIESPGLDGDMPHALFAFEQHMGW